MAKSEVSTLDHVIQLVRVGSDRLFLGDLRDRGLFYYKRGDLNLTTNSICEVDAYYTSLTEDTNMSLNKN